MGFRAESAWEFWVVFSGLGLRGERVGGRRGVSFWGRKVGLEDGKGCVCGVGFIFKLQLHSNALVTKNQTQSGVVPKWGGCCR